MGIYDRDYIRKDRPPSGFGGGGPSFGRAGLGMLSANTWIIILCVAVFAIDGFTPTDWVITGGPYPNEGETIPANYAYHTPPPNLNVPWTLSDVMDPDTGEIVGVVRLSPMHFLEKYLHFSTAKGFLGFEFWRLIGFQFLHANLAHLFFNMLALFFFGPLVENYLGGKRYVAFYLLAGICGSLLYMLLNLTGFVVTQMAGEAVQVPGLIFNDPRVPLVGASAGVFGVLMAGAYIAPNAIVLLFFFLPMRLKTLAYVLVGIAAYTVIIGGPNAGGEAGHLGGAIAGFYFIRRPHHLHGFFDFLGRLDPTSHHYRGGGQHAGPGRPRSRSVVDDAEIDRILIKIKEQGMQSLTDRERRILREKSRGD